MDIKKVGIIEKDNFSNDALECLKKYYDVSFYDGTDSLSFFVQDKYALFVRLAHKIDDQLIKDAVGLKYICSPTTGLNHIAISSPKIQTISLKGEYNFLSTIRATPEHIMGLTFSLLRNYKFAFRTNDNEVWNRDPYRGYEIFNNDIGIIGYGRIGKLLAGFFKAFGARVYIYEDNIERCKEAQMDESLSICANIEELIQKSVVIILCANYEPKNEKMLEKRHFSMMHDKYFINAARGELINENDLIQFIEEGKFRGVALDVFANETGAMNIYKRVVEISGNKNVIITPHIGGATFTSMHRTEEFIVNKLLRIDKHIM